MANNYVVNPIRIDTSFASYKGQVAATLGTLFTLIVIKVRWVGPGAVGQVDIVDPQGGEQLCALQNSSANGADIEEDFSASPRLWRDFSVNLPSGVLFIYTK
jgi:hypothetical protein